MSTEVKTTHFSQDDQEQMYPPWIMYPKLWCHSKHWNSGKPSEYLQRFTAYILSMSSVDREAYAHKFIEPPTWKDIYLGSLPDHAVIRWRTSMTPKYYLPEIKANAMQGRNYDIRLFYGHYQNRPGIIDKSCFSQWYSMSFVVNDIEFCCMEQFMMAYKALLFEDSDAYDKIMSSADPKTIKSLGRGVRNFDQAVWDTYKYTIILNGNWAKFSQNPELAKFLLSTGDSILAEASPYDGIWGIKMSARDPYAYNPANWKGFNLLGLALMEVRDELRRVYANIPELFSQ